MKKGWWNKVHNGNGRTDDPGVSLNSAPHPVNYGLTRWKRLRVWLYVNSERLWFYAWVASLPTLVFVVYVSPPWVYAVFGVISIIAQLAVVFIL
jgi:hypothetical protein